MKKALVWLLVLAAAAVVILLRLTSGREEAPARGIEEIQAEQGIPVDAVTLRRGELVLSLEMSGEVFGRRQTNLSPGADRRIERVYVREGDLVSRGQAVLRFDVSTSPDQMTQLAQLREAAENARRQVDRLRPLNERGAISDSDLDAAETQLAIAEASLRDAHLQVEMVSPIDGLVTLVAVTPGEDVTAGETVAQVAALDSVRVVAEVSAEVARQLRPGAPVQVAVGRGDPGGLKAGNSPEVSARSTGACVLAGRLTRAAIGADPATRLYVVEAVLANPGTRLRPGEYVTLSVAVETVPSALSVPRTALLGATDVMPGAGVQVYRVRDGRAELRDIRAGTVTEDRVEVADGLEDGDVVVVFGANRLQDGAKVRLHELDGVRADAAVPVASEGAAGSAPAGGGEADL